MLENSSKVLINIKQNELYLWQLNNLNHVEILIYNSDFEDINYGKVKYDCHFNWKYRV